MNNPSEVKGDENIETNSYSLNGRLIAICTHPLLKLSRVAPLIMGNLSKSPLAFIHGSHLLLQVFTSLFISGLLYSFNLLLYFGSFWGAFICLLTSYLPSRQHPTSFSISYLGYLKDTYSQVAFIYLPPNLSSTLSNMHLSPTTRYTTLIIAFPMFTKWSP